MNLTKAYQTMNGATDKGSDIDDRHNQAMLDVEADMLIVETDFNAHVADTAEHGATGAVVGTTNTQTLTNKTLTTPIIASLYQDAEKTKLITMPAATDTLVGLATADTLTNKILSDDTCSFGDSADVTKKLEVELSGATTGKTMTIASSHTDNRTITLPNATDTLIGLATVDSITGAKTFDKDKVLMKGTSTGVTTLSTANTGATSYTQTMQAKNGTIACQDDVTYIGTTSVALNRASNALTLAGITLTTPDIGTPSAGTLTNCTGYPAASTTAAGIAPQATAPAAGLYNYVGITNGETAYTNKALFDATVPSTQAFGDAAAAGSAAVAARRDHKHAMPAAEKDTTAQTGILKGNGSAISAASQGTDYYAPSGTDVAVADGGTGASTAAAALTNLGIVIVRKTSDETVNDSNVLQDDDQLKFAIAANEIWSFQIYVRTSKKAASDFQVTVTVPAGASGGWQLFNDASSTTSERAFGAGYASVDTVDSSPAIRIMGIASNGATPGYVTLQWSQNTAVAEDTKVLANSHIIAIKLA
jgi:hypothetical protein